jgi:hypothetical protein
MSPPPWDPRLANDAAAVDHCMKLGAVVLKPPSTPRLGFRADSPS